MEIEWSLLASRQLNDVLDFVATEYSSITARKVLKNSRAVMLCTSGRESSCTRAMYAILNAPKIATASKMMRASV
jgi:hypothetical protein